MSVSFGSFQSRIVGSLLSGKLIFGSIDLPFGSPQSRNIILPHLLAAVFSDFCYLYDRCFTEGDI